MASLDLLAPDQRAVVALVLQQGRSYEEIAGLLGISRSAVRSRAHAGLTALAPPDAEVPADEAAQLADFVLGQQDAAGQHAARELVAGSSDARRWTIAVSARLRDLAPERVPDLGAPDDAGTASALPASGRDARPAAAPVRDAAAPEEPAAASSRDAAAPEEPAAASNRDAAAPEEPAAASSRDAGAPEEPAAASNRDAAAPEEPVAAPVRDAGAPDDQAPAHGAAAEEGPAPASPRSSRLGGALLIGGTLLAVAAVIAFFVLRGDGDEPAGTAARATATPTATPQVVGQVPLRAVGSGSRARGSLTLFLIGSKLGFQIQAQRLPANRTGETYAIWFTGPGSKATLIGVTRDPVGRSGTLVVTGPPSDSAARFPQQLAGHRRVVVSREKTTGTGRRPGPAVLRGTLPGG